MNVELTIETYLKKLVLSDRAELVNDIFRFLADEIKTENSIGNEERIAKLFCRAVESINQDLIPNDDIKKAILYAFENIRTIGNNAHNNGELMCIYLLNLLYSKEDSLDKIPQNDFVLLLDNLEKIRCIFKISDDNSNLVFPIGILLFRLINSDNLFAEIEKASSVQALMLALQVFDKSQYPQELKDIEKMAEDGTFDVLPKKEVTLLKKEWAKLEANLGGIKDMKKIPDAIFVVDPKKEKICIQEAHSLGITLIGIADTNADPEELDYIIPGNDDAIRAIKLIVSKMADAVIEAKQGDMTEEEAAMASSEEDFSEEEA